MKDTSFDEPAIKSMYDNQLAQLENLIATQRKAQLKMREQLASAEKRYHKIISELEDEKRKHAQDTAQGDDVTYMLEKERERLKQEIDFEKAQVKRMEKDLKKTLASLEEERANSLKHKKVALMLIKERKKLMERMLHEKNKSVQIEQILDEEKDKMINMAEGLVQESKKSLKMEAAMEKQISEFDIEREQLRNKLSREEQRNKDLQSQVNSLTQHIDDLQKHLHTVEKSVPHSTLQSIEIKSSASPVRGQAGGAGLVQSGLKVSPKSTKAVTVEGRSSASPDRDYSYRSADVLLKKPVNYSSPSSPTSFDRLDSRSDQRVAPVGASYVERSPDGSPTHRVHLAQGSSATVVTPGGGKISFHVGQSGGGGGSPRKMAPAGRGAPPPLPPNKPVLNPAAAGPKPVLPPKVGAASSKDHVSVSGQEAGDQHSRPVNSLKSVQIPVNVVGGQSAAPGSRSSSRDTSPMRKTAQSLASQALEYSEVTSPVTPTLDFLGPEMADLQQLLATMTTGETSASSTSSLVNIASPPVHCSPYDIRNSPLHKHAACGQVDSLRTLILDCDADVNLPVKNGTTPVHSAVEFGQVGCLQFLLENGGNVNAQRDNLYSPLHIAAEVGHIGCLQLLLIKGADVNLTNHLNETPLHVAAVRGRHGCCHLLIEHGSHPLLMNTSGHTPLHCSVLRGHANILELLLNHISHHRIDDNDYHAHLQQAIVSVDKDGWSIVHMAASLGNEACLKILLEMAPVDLDIKDNLGRSAYVVASKRCRDFLNEIGHKNSQHVQVCVELDIPFDKNIVHKSYVIGTVEVSQQLMWHPLEDRLQCLLCDYFVGLDHGLRTRKISRLEPETHHHDLHSTLGLTTVSIKQFQISYFVWNPGAVSDKLPYDILCNNDVKKISIFLENSTNGCETLAFDMLYPVQTLQNYLRLLEQYKSVVFYGPVGSGKSYLTETLAHCIANKERCANREPIIYRVPLNCGFTNADLLEFLKQKGCMVHVRDSVHNKSPIVILDDLEKVNITQLFGDLLDPIEYRGKTYSFRIKGEVDSGQENYYFLDNFYLLATMNRARSTGLDLHIQQRLRWVHFRLDTEPFSNLLARHLQRQLCHLYGGRLPTTDDPIFKCVEWIICVWQRLNDSLIKLGLPDVAFGPCLFFSCPLERRDPQEILKWMKDLWNNVIAPQVCNAVKRGTGSDPATDGQKKVANTALYVLMQRSVVLGCSLTGKEKDLYLSGFSGSNELDIPLRSEKCSSLGVHLGGNKEAGSDKSTKERQPRVEVLISDGRHKHKHRWLDQHFSNGLSNSKRRSLSDSSVDRTAHLEKFEQQQQQQQQQQQLQLQQQQQQLQQHQKQQKDGEVPASQPKMRKLEIRSPVLLPLSSSTRTSQFDHHSSAKRTPNSLSHQHHSSSFGSKKSRSSENISADSYHYASSHRRASNPFSFSLTMPTPSLNSFMFPGADSPGSASLTGGSSPNLNSHYFSMSYARRRSDLENHDIISSRYLDNKDVVSS
ncbi:cortactin-binding protein 2-like isoform X2 [Gigantopelta aegis]|nr:cortactin-binding protein 2-like isoform X2 [Gigantopelta aegis]